MRNNTLIRSIQKSLKLSSETILSIYQIADSDISLTDIEDVLKHESEDNYVELSDEGLLLFLDSLIVHLRGNSGNPPQSVDIDNNVVLKKLRIALNMRDDDMVAIFAFTERPLKKSEITPFFRKNNHKQYKGCQDPLMRTFFKGLSIYVQKNELNIECV
jgi:uncharacterized protein YehS (DUF1456 family)